MKLVSHEEHKKQMWMKMSLYQKIHWKWLGVVLWFEDTAHKLFGWGEHSTIGKVGGRKCFCLVCNKWVKIVR